MKEIDKEWLNINEVIKRSVEQKNKKLLLELVMLLVHYMDSRFYNLERLIYVKNAIEAAQSLEYIYQVSLLKLDALGWTYIEEGNEDNASNDGNTPNLSKACTVIQ